jgi:Skp family chaperone for outer membrane proteins
MAKAKDTSQMSDADKEKQAHTEWEQQKKLREKKQKEREERKKRREKLEMKRIQTIINFPFSALLKLSIVIGLISFVYKFFGSSDNLTGSLFFAFIVCAGVYVGAGIIMAIVIFFISEVKKRELNELIKLEREKKLQEEQQRKLEEQQRQEEEAKLEEQMNRELREELRKHEETMRLNAATVHQTATHPQQESIAKNNPAQTISPDLPDAIFMNDNMFGSDSQDNSFDEDSIINDEIQKVIK